MMSKLRNLAEREIVWAVAVFIITLGIYRQTVCPVVSFTDSGELATVATTLGIAHPTGYPLWTLIGRIAAMIPLGSEPIVRLNMLAGILTALAVAFFFKLILIIDQSPRVFGFTGRKSSPKHPWIFLFGAFITALSVGFSSTVWSQSVEIEVYALHALFLMATSVLFVSGLEDQLSHPGQVSKRLLGFAYLLGLSFGNHMTTILLAPGFLYLFFASLGVGKRSWQLTAYFVPLFILGLTVYAYLPLRSSAGPLLDWGHPVTLERLWWHITGKQYQTWMFAGTGVMRKQLSYFVSNFPNEYSWPFIVLLVMGVIEVSNRSKRLLVFLLLLFVTCLTYAINFDIHEIDPYFLLAYVACGVALGFAVKEIVQWSSGRKELLMAVVIAGCVALPVAQVVGNWKNVDQSSNYQATDFVHDAFAQLPHGSVVFASLWDYFVSPAYYSQIVRNERRDIVIVDEELLKNRTWYFVQFERDHPGFLEMSEVPVRAFLTELNKFEKGEKFDFATINARWSNLTRDLIQKLLPVHAVYVDPRIAPDFVANFDAVPEGLFVRLTEKGKPASWAPIERPFRPGTFSNYVTSDLRRYYASMYTYHSYWLLSQRRQAEAVENLGQALRVDPTYMPALELKSRLEGQGR